MKTINSEKNEFQLDIPGHFQFAYRHYFPSSPLYARLCKQIADDEEMINLAAQCKYGEPPCFMLLGAINYILISEGKNLLDVPISDGDQIPDDFEKRYKAIKDLCMKYNKTINILLRNRRVQTNEVGRSCIFAMGAAIASKEIGIYRFHLVDVGTSVGLNLFWDKYHISFVSKYNNNWCEWIRPQKSSVRLECQIEKNTIQLGALKFLPKIKILDRIGIELEPINRDSSDDLLWLRSLIWPNQPSRIQRFENALAETREKSFRLVRGDAAKILADACKDLSPKDPILVTHSYLLDKMSNNQRAQFKRQLSILGNKCPTIEIGIEISTANASWYVSLWSRGKKVTRIATGSCHPHGDTLSIL